MRHDNPNRIWTHEFGSINASSWGLGGEISPDVTCSWCGGLVYKPEWGEGDGITGTDYARKRIWLEKTDDYLYICNDCLENDVQVSKEMQDKAIELLAQPIPKASDIARARELILMSRVLLWDIEGRVAESRAGRRERVRAEIRKAAPVFTFRPVSGAERAKPNRRYRRGKWQGPTNVYLMRSKLTGLIKIGRSVKPKLRRVQLQTQIDDQLEIIKVIPDPEGDLETKLHHRFEELRATHPNSPKSREWFELRDDLLDFASGE